MFIYIFIFTIYPVTIPAGCVVCSWCNKVVANKMFSLKTPTGLKSFCSELCFTQCRRANFKRNKTCDWCRHIRHTVNYVDFQDGDHQLQFCSDKCLNQYKMNIFCRETEAHLQLHPHLQDSSPGGGSSSAGNNPSAGLITPELWMRDCRSESPVSDRSTPPREQSPVEIKLMVRQNEPKPVIPPPALEITKIERKDAKRRVIPLKSRRKCSTMTLEQRGCSSSPRSGGSTPPKSNILPPPLLPINGAQIPHLLHPNVPPDHPLLRPPHHFPPGFFQPPHLFPPEHTMFRPRFFHPSSPPSPPRPQPRSVPPFPTPHPPPRPLLPPVTILVPYPVALPIPIPLPVPIPIPLPPEIFLLAKEGKEETKETSNHQTEEEKEKENNSKPVTEERSPSPTAPRPIRKRKRITTPPPTDGNVAKRKSVPV